MKEKQIAGHFYNKYETKNILERLLVKKFHEVIREFVAVTGAQTIHEVGCGEGYLSIDFSKNYKTVQASDIDEEMIVLAKDNAANKHLKVDFIVSSIKNLTSEHKADVVICCEVLEHIKNPKETLLKLTTLATPWIILSVPREPLWSALNLLRGKYWSTLGNTPGHVQKWNKNSFIKLVSEYFDIHAVETPLPWVLLLCKTKHNRHNNY